MLRVFLRCFAYLVVALAVCGARAGSYEDFFAAIKQDNGAAITGLLQRGFDPNTPSPDGQHGLFLALREPSLKAAQALLDWPKTNVDARNATDETPLMMAALKGHMAVVRQLVARDADVNKPGWAPLHYAATGGHVEIMEFLLEHHAFIDAESPNGTTPLMMAAQYGSTAAVKLLLQAGADTSMRNQLGLSALDFAQRGARPDAIALLSTGEPARPGGPAAAPTPPAPPAPPSVAAPAQPRASAPGADPSRSGLPRDAGASAPFRTESIGPGPAPDPRPAAPPTTVTRPVPQPPDSAGGAVAPQAAPAPAPTSGRW